MVRTGRGHRGRASREGRADRRHGLLGHRRRVPRQARRPRSAARGHCCLGRSARARVWFPRLLRRTVARVVRREELWGGNRETFRNVFFSRNSLLLFTLRGYRQRQRRYAEQTRPLQPRAPAVAARGRALPKASVRVARRQRPARHSLGVVPWRRLSVWFAVTGAAASAMAVLPGSRSPRAPPRSRCASTCGTSRSSSRAGRFPPAPPCGSSSATAAGRRTTSSSAVAERACSEPARARP